MMVFRIIKPAFAASALTGEGARRYGGRWNTPGIACVYAAGSRALAALELLVHASPELLRVEFQLVEIELPDALIESGLVAPPRWDEFPAGANSQDFGNRWLKRSMAAAKAALAVPSVIMPEEMNYLLNPLHPAFRDVGIRRRRRFRLDPRLHET
jgi:RES domain-containing protein